MIFVNAMRDFADGLVKGFGLYLTERDAHVARPGSRRARPATAAEHGFTSLDFHPPPWGPSG